MSSWKVRSGVILVKIKGVYLLVADKEARRNCPYIREINEIGAFIWERLEEGKEPDDIGSQLRQEYDVPQEYDLEADINGFFSVLVKYRYLICEA